MKTYGLPPTLAACECPASFASPVVRTPLRRSADLPKP
jgi:hypothetical protein